MNTKRKIEILRAYEEGKTIIERSKNSSSEWQISKKEDGEYYAFNFLTCDYEIKFEDYKNLYHCGSWIEKQAVYDALSIIEEMTEITGFKTNRPELEKLKKVAA